MKRSEATKFITDILFYGKLAESVRLGARKDFITNLAEEDAEAVLKELEALGMFYCPVEDFGEFQLRTPKGWETEDE
jgi:hypothetical protein